MSLRCTKLAISNVTTDFLTSEYVQSDVGGNFRRFEGKHMQYNDGSALLVFIWAIRCFLWKLYAFLIVIKPR